MPHLNAALNGVAFCLLATGRVLIKQRRVTAHRNCMLGAASASGLFLVCYVIHYVWRYSVQGGSHTPFHGQGWAKGFYYTVLISHVTLAITVPFLAVWLIRLGLGRQDEKHRRLAAVGFPLWMYVSVTGVMIYVMLFWLNPTP